MSRNPFNCVELSICPLSLQFSLAMCFLPLSPSHWPNTTICMMNKTPDKPKLSVLMTYSLLCWFSKCLFRVTLWGVVTITSVVLFPRSCVLRGGRPPNSGWQHGRYSGGVRPLKEHLAAEDVVSGFVREETSRVRKDSKERLTCPFCLKASRMLLESAPPPPSQRLSVFLL